MHKLIVVLPIIAAANVAAAQQTQTERAILAARDTVWRAWFAGDTARLNRFIPSAAAASAGSNTVSWDDRARMVGGARDFARGGGRLEKIDFTNTRTDITGNSAFVRSDFRLIIRNGAKVDTSQGHAAEVFVRDGARWVNPYWHLEYVEAGALTARLFTFPDTLGTRVAMGDSARALGSATDYDALVGTWEFRYQWRNPNGEFGDSFPGHWTFEKKGAGIIEDQWRADDPKTTMATSLHTYRIFDPARKVWQMIGAGSNGGAITPGISWSDSANRYGFERAPNGSIMRFRYFDISPDHFLWRSDRSFDGGKTWVLDEGMMEARRIGR